MLNVNIVCVCVCVHVQRKDVKGVIPLNTVVSVHTSTKSDAPAFAFDVVRRTHVAHH